jgi:hypothetical protein
MANTNNADTVTENGMLKSTMSTLVANPTGGATTDAEARTAINAILDILEEHNLMSDT